MCISPFQSFVALSAVGLCILGYGFVRGDSRAPTKVHISEVEYVTDFSNDQMLVGASHNVFVGKVMRTRGAKDRGLGPETQYQVEVVENIKGDLSGVVTVNQEGGYQDGVLRIVGETGLSPLALQSEYLLKPGYTYLLATRYSERERWYTLISHPAARKLLSTDAKKDANDLRQLTHEDSRVNELTHAYPREILLEADVRSNKAFNSYVHRDEEALQ